MSRWLAKQPQTSTATATTTCFSSLPRPAEKAEILAFTFQGFQVWGWVGLVLCCLAFGIQGFRLGVVASLISEFILLLLRSSSCASYMSLFELFAWSASLERFSVRFTCLLRLACTRPCCVLSPYVYSYKSDRSDRVERLCCGLLVQVCPTLSESGVRDETPRVAHGGHEGNRCC